tara:strand:- start:1734 stop:2453 length:720 start_codon:yes stop_codon:yes gene_type:complete
MSRIRADQIVNRVGTGAPTAINGLRVTGVCSATDYSGLSGTAADFPNGATVTGVCTATDFSGPSASAADFPNGLTATTGNFSGVLTYEDVNNVDSIGIITARAGTDLNGFKVEEGGFDSSTSLNGTFGYDLDTGHVQTYSAATGGNYGPNFTVSGSSVNAIMDVGDVATATLMVASSSHYLAGANVQIDGTQTNVSFSYVGGSAPSAANGSGFDIYTFTIQKTASTPAYRIFINALGAA